MPVCPVCVPSPPVSFYRSSLLSCLGTVAITVTTTELEP
jgi:hypothetical protein